VISLIYKNKEYFVASDFNESINVDLLESELAQAKKTMSHLEDMVKNLENPWIPATERLPEIRSYVNSVNPAQSRPLLIIEATAGSVLSTFSSNIILGWYRARDGFMSVKGKIDNVTHWKEIDLPEKNK